MRRERYFRVPVDQLVPRSFRPDEMRDLRQLWRRFARQGRHLPPNIGAITIEEGKP